MTAKGSAVHLGVSLNIVKYVTEPKCPCKDLCFRFFRLVSTFQSCIIFDDKEQVAMYCSFAQEDTLVIFSEVTSVCLTTVVLGSKNCSCPSFRPTNKVLSS